MFFRHKGLERGLEKTYADGEIIVHEGDESREMYIIQEGEITITKTMGEREVVLATLARGDFFGEMSLLESLPRSATARAKGETKVLVVQTGGFLLKIRRDPTFAFEMLQRLSGRIRAINERLIGALEEADPSIETLKEIIERSEFAERQEPDRDH